MKRAAWMLAIGFGCTAMVAAQSGSSQTPGSQQSGTITVTGCLQHGDTAGATGTTGSTAGTSTAGASASRSTSGSGNAASFILTNASMGSSSASRSPSGSTAGGTTAGGATSAGSATGTSGTGSTYILEPGSAQSELTSNTNKKVEVTGTLDTSMSHSASSTPSSAGTTSSGSTASSAAGSTGSASASMANAQHLKVSSVRVIAESCR